MAYVPTKFHWDSFKRRWKSDQPLQTNLYYYYADNNNSEDETTQKQDPIPLLGEWDN